MRWSIARRLSSRTAVAALAVAFVAACSSDGAPDAPAAACEAPAGRADGAIVSGGVERRFLQHVPVNARSGAPLVIALHGYGGTGAAMDGVAGMSATAEARGTVLLAPDALPGDGGVPSWRLSPVGDDVGFVEDLIDHAVEALCVDPERVHITGHSQGGFFISTLACTSADRIVSVAPVSGMREAPEGCAPADPVPLLAIHGTADDIVLFDGGLRDDAASMLALPPAGPSIPDLVEAWRERHPGVEVGLLPVEDHGHGWWPPANDVIWDFFERR